MESELGKGTTFTVKLPLLQQDTRASLEYRFRCGTAQQYTAVRGSTTCTL